MLTRDIRQNGNKILPVTRRKTSPPSQIPEKTAGTWVMSGRKLNNLKCPSRRYPAAAGMMKKRRNITDEPGKKAHEESGRDAQKSAEILEKLPAIKDHNGGEQGQRQGYADDVIVCRKPETCASRSRKGHSAPRSSGMHGFGKEVQSRKCQQRIQARQLDAETRLGDKNRKRAQQHPTRR